MIAVTGQSRIAHPGHLRLLRQPFGNGERIVGMALHTQRQRLDAGDDEECVERRQRRAKIAQRSPSTRQAMAKAKLPKVSCSTMPEYSGRGSHSIGYFLSRDQLKLPPSTIMPPIELP